MLVPFRKQNAGTTPELLRKPVLAGRIEPRWPVALTLVGALVLLALLPGRLRLFPGWIPYVLIAIQLVPMTAVTISRRKTEWLRIEAIVEYITLFGAAFGVVAQLFHLFSEMVSRSHEVSGLQLLSSSIAIWAINVVIFALLYWRIDRGGPEARMNEAEVRSEWRFPLDDASDVAPRGWRPAFVDYLFLAYCTATAFSPAEAQPITSRAKLLMMLQSSVSLVTIAAVAARAINILGS